MCKNPLPPMFAAVSMCPASACNSYRIFIFQYLHASRGCFACSSFTRAAIGEYGDGLEFGVGCLGVVLVACRLGRGYAAGLCLKLGRLLGQWAGKHSLIACVWIDWLQTCTKHNNVPGGSVVHDKHVGQ